MGWQIAKLIFIQITACWQDLLKYAGEATTVLKMMKNSGLNLPEKKFRFFLSKKIGKIQNWKSVYNKIIGEKY